MAAAFQDKHKTFNFFIKFLQNKNENSGNCIFYLTSIIKLEKQAHRKSPRLKWLKISSGLDDTLTLRLAGNWNIEATLSHLANSLLYQDTLPLDDKKFSNFRDSQVTNLKFPEFSYPFPPLTNYVFLSNSIGWTSLSVNSTINHLIYVVSSLEVLWFQAMAHIELISTLFY